jgi:hypothetical protein
MSDLCGDVEHCIRTIDPNACSGAGAPAQDGSTPEAGIDDDASPFAPPPPNTGEDAGLLEAGLPPALGCQVTSQDGKPVAQCQPAGKGLLGAPCASSGDCAAGFACVGGPNAAQCRPYCCQSPEACPPDTYCASQPLHESALLVPVCVGRQLQPVGALPVLDGRHLRVRGGYRRWWCETS